MKWDLQSFTNSRFGVGFSLWIGRNLPPKISYRIGDTFAYLIAKRRNKLTQAIRINQWVVRGENISAAELDQAVQEVLQHAGRCFADTYYNLNNPEGLKALTPKTAMVEKLIEHSQLHTRGAFVVAPHMSAFDLALLAAAYRGMRAKVLTYGSPTSGYRIQNKIRAATGLEITPVRDESTHQEIIAWMQQGGIAITAVDRPIRRKAHTLTFFGRPSPLPAGHIRMALAADVPVIVAAAHMDDNRLYHISVSEPIPMTRHPDSTTEIRQNGEAVLKVMEAYIRKAPGQWLMYYPLWPDVDLSVTEK